MPNIRIKYPENIQQNICINIIIICIAEANGLLNNKAIKGIQKVPTIIKSMMH